MLDRATEAAGARTADQLVERIEELQDELRTTKQRSKTGAASDGGRPNAQDLAGAPRQVGPAVRLVSWSGDAGSIDELKATPATVRSALGDGVIALGLDADEPLQLFVTVSDDLVAKGVAAGVRCVQAAAAAIDGAGRRAAADGAREGDPSGGARRYEALAAIKAALARAGSG